MNKDISKTNFRVWNEEMAVKYNPDDFHNSKNIFIRWIEGMRVNKIVQSASAYKGKKVLEVGCGAGNILKKIPFDKIYGIDISEVLLKRAKIKLNGRAHLALGDGEKMPFREDGFDMVICTEVVEHTYSPQALLENICRVLNSEGKLIISIPNEGLINFLKKLYFGIFIFRRHNPDKESGYKIARKMDDEWHLHKFEIAGFVKLLEKYFEVRRVCRIPHYFLPIRYLIFCAKRIPAA